MLMPKRTKYRKTMRGRNRDYASCGTEFTFGGLASKATEAGRINSRQIEVARIALTRFVKRQGKTWIRVFPDKSLTEKPLETHMGKGKGAVEEWVMSIKPGRIIYETAEVNEEVAREALTLAMHKLPLKTKFVTRGSQNEIY